MPESAPLYTEAHPGSLARLPRDLVRARYVLRDLVWKDIRVRYRYAVLGFLWTILEPLFLMLVLTFVLRYVLNLRFEEGNTVGQDAMQVLWALLAWQFFANGVSQATTSVIDNRNLVTKVYFPREVLPLASIGVALFNFVLGAAVFSVLFVMVRGALPAATVLAIPLIFLIEITLVCGLGMLLACLNTAFRDVGYMVTTAIMFGFYASPIFYPASEVQKQLPDFYPFYFLNPMAGLITAYRELLNGSWPHVFLVAWPGACALVSLVVGLIVFRRMAPTLADRL